jgi:hypothetical protein
MLACGGLQVEVLATVGDLLVTLENLIFMKQSVEVKFGCE